MKRETTGTGQVHKRWKPLVRRGLLALAGLLLGLNAYLANARGILGNELPMPFGYGMANVLSGSMEPTFSRGTLLFVKEGQDVQVGDIVVYQSGQELIVHRVIAVSGETIMTQGDANNAADEPFDRSRIKGKVIGWVPVLGSVAAVLKTPVAVIMMLAAALLLVEGSFRRQKAEDDRELDAIKEEIRRLKKEQQEQGQNKDGDKAQ